MTTYKDSGVDIAAGDSASKAAYAAAAKTFASRKGMIGAPVFEVGGCAGFLDMGDYYLVMTDDGTGTKIDVALAAGNCKTFGIGSPRNGDGRCRLHGRGGDRREQHD